MSWELDMPMIKIDILNGDFENALNKMEKTLKEDTMTVAEKGNLMQNYYFTFCTYLQIQNQKITENNANHFLQKFSKLFDISGNLEFFREKTEIYYNSMKTLELEDDIAALSEIVQLEAPLRLKCFFLNKFITLTANEIIFYKKYKKEFDYAVKELQAYHDGMNNGTI